MFSSISKPFDALGIPTFTAMKNPMDSLLFHPPHPPSYTLNSPDIVNKFGMKIIDHHGVILIVSEKLLLANSTTNSSCILYVHGNASDCGQECEAFSILSNRLNLDIIMVEFPGFGAYQKEKISTSEKSVDMAVSVAWTFAESKFPANRIIIMGRSIGTGPATRLARNLCSTQCIPLALVLWSSIESIQDSAARIAGQFISLFIDEARWSPSRDIEIITCPILFISGEQDTLTPLAMTDNLKRKAIHAPIIFEHRSPAADHNQNWNLEIDVIYPIEFMLDGILTSSNTSNSISTDEDEILTTTTTLDFINTNNPNHQLTRTTTSTTSFPAPLPTTPFDIVIVGCGPVGLWTAVNIKHQRPQTRIVMLDKHETFQRAHVLRLEKSSLEGGSPMLQSIISAHVGVTRTNTLENVLKVEAERVGIEFLRPYQVQDVTTDILTKFGTPSIVIACDGAKSICREQCFGGLSHRESLSYVIDVRFLTKTPKSLGKIDLLKCLAAVPHSFQESIGKKPNAAGLFPGTLRLISHQQEYDVMRSMSTLRNPCTWKQRDKLPKDVYKTVQGYFNTRSKAIIGENNISDETLDRDNVQLVPIDLSIYCAKRYVSATQQQQRLFLAGDSAFGVPFFRALNAGLLCGAQAALCIVEELNQSNSTNSILHDRGDLIMCKGVDNFQDQLQQQQQPDIMSPTATTTTTTTTTNESSLLSKPFHFMGGLVKRSTLSMTASMQVSQILAQSSIDVVEDVVTTPHSDPLRKYNAFVERICKREFIAAKAKRDLLHAIKKGTTVSSVNNSLST
jgi:2-polyprenyl-6-methoxyphenol hydroxylase-like FAD-dependent oxidoreductase/pimeloyl-ACP methyl ester carboxylesterase